LAAEVTRSAASDTPISISHATFSTVRACIAAVDGVRFRMAAMATVLSV
jgi:hypothetical protein